MKKRFFSVKTLMSMALISTFMLSACNAPDDVSVNQKVKNFFFTQQREANNLPEKSLKLADDYSVLLNDRVRLKLPIGSERPTDYQMQQLYLPIRTSDVFPKEFYLIWAKDDEILVVHAFEMFVPSGNNFKKAVYEFFEANNKDRFDIKFTTHQTQQPIVVFRDRDRDNQSVYNDIYLMSAITAGADNNLICLQMNLYALATNRISDYEDLALDILKTVVAGARRLDTEAKTVVLDGADKLQIDIPDQYVSCYDGNSAQENYRYGAKKENGNFP